MSWINEGAEWQARALEQAAKEETHQRFAGETHEGAGYAMAYLTGVRDTLRVLAGDADPRAVRPTFAAVYERYLDSI